MSYYLTNNVYLKSLSSPAYNYRFNKETGTFLRWGTRLADNPQYSPFGPEIADIEISKNGCSGGCRYCYKANTDDPPTNMTLTAFEKILDAMLPTVTQVAFGITDIHANPDFLEMMRYCRLKGVVPNFTTTGSDLDDEFLMQLPDLVGAVAVSCSPMNPRLCFSTVVRLIEAGVKQVNIHVVNTGDSLYEAGFFFEVLESAKRIPELNALVLLALKQKGRAVGMRAPSREGRRLVIRDAVESGIRLGLDSCSAHDYIALYGDSPEVEPCESGLFSAYVNVDGLFFPCSFAEGVEKGIPVDGSFHEVWKNGISAWRENLLANGRRCPLFNL